MAFTVFLVSLLCSLEKSQGKDKLGWGGNRNQDGDRIIECSDAGVGIGIGVGGGVVIGGWGGGGV